ncbi:MAG: pyridoxine 5'-phosphate synthase [Verrucomicrobiota bacterium]
MSAPTLELGVNIDHVATLRQARYRDQPTEGPRRVEPDPVAAALACEAAGCHGITAHLREDRRHIIDRDVRRLREAIRTRLNFEMAITPEIVAFALDIKPDIVCIVPERREEVTTEGGLDVVGHEEAITATCARMRDAGIATSLFIGPDPAQISAAARAGADAIELHTGRYGDHWHLKRERNDEIQRLVAAARQAHELGLQVNAGHGLNVENLPLIHLVPHLVELNIGHSIVSRAVFIGLDAAVKEMLKAMEGYPG